MNEFVFDKKCIKGSISFMEYDTDDIMIERLNNTKIINLVLYGIKKGTPISFKNEEIDDLEDIEQNIIQDDIEDELSREVEKTIEFRLGRLAQVIFKLLYQSDDETDEGDCFIVLDEIAKLKSIIEIKYQKHLKIEKYKEYLNNLYYLDREVRRKITMINYANNIDQILEGRSR